VRAVVITPDGMVSVANLSGYEDFVKEVGGYLEAIYLDGCVCYVNEDGKAARMLPNWKATAFVKQMLVPLGRMMLPGDYIVGTAIFVGLAVDEGSFVDADLPEAIASSILGRIP
jgi:hypothetical protein